MEAQYSAREVLEELTAIAMARTTDVLQVQDGKLVIRDIRDAAAVAAVEQTPNGLRVKFYDKLKALELLGKSLGLFTGGPPPELPKESSLLKALLAGTGEEVTLHDLPEAEQTAVTHHDLVESAGTG